MLESFDLFDCEHTVAAEYLNKHRYPWEVLPDIAELILLIKKRLGAEYAEVSPGVYIHKTAKAALTAFIGAPCIIGAETEVRHCAFIRGNAIIGENCVIGNSTEIKNSILFDGVKAPHYNYIGDSILGYKAHLGAGAVISNVKSLGNEVIAVYDGVKMFTGLKKFGALLGDFAEIGCNCVLNPGTVVGRNSVIYPLSSVRGHVPSDSIYKNKNEIIPKLYKCK